jgi:FtsH-binding integral membrane protein
LSIPYNVAVPVARTGVERAVLVRRTYGVVFLGVLVTMAGAAFTMAQPAVLEQSARHPIITFLIFFGTMILAQRSHRVFPQNIAITLLATFVAGVMIAPMLYYYNRAQPGIVGQAAALTFMTFGALSLYATFSRRDFSAWGGFFMVGVVVLLITSLLNWFFKNETASLWLAAGTVFVFGGLLVFDTWRIVRSNQYGPDDYVLAAVSIYLDVLNLFLAILRLLGGRRS